jgi:hypothetical protein
LQAQGVGIAAELEVQPSLERQRARHRALEEQGVERLNLPAHDEAWTEAERYVGQVQGSGVDAFDGDVEIGAGERCVGGAGDADGGFDPEALHAEIDAGRKQSGESGLDARGAHADRLAGR